MLFDKLGELADKISAHPIFLALFNIGLAGLWVIVGTDVANIFISIITAEIVLIGAGAARRGNVAIHAKLDELIHTSEARDDLLNIEQKSEKEILEVRI